MSFALPDLILESVLREGLASVRANPEPLQEVFASLNKIAPVITNKYGQQEIQRIMDYLVNREISFVQSYALVPANLPCISLLLVADDESEEWDHLEDFEAEIIRPITDPVALQALILASSIVPQGFSSLTGLIQIDDSVDLTRVTPNKLFVDASGVTWNILTVTEVPGAQTIGIAIGSQPDLTDFCSIKSSINYTQYEQRGTMSRERIRLGCHTEDRLLTAYLYVLVKWILNSRKVDVINRGFDLGVIKGTDFSRDLEYLEPVFTRFMDLTGKVQDSWASDIVQPIDNIVTQVEVQRDVATNEQLGLEDQTVQVDDDSEQD